MSNYLDKIDISQIKRAIDVEEKFKYINIMGKETDFAKFMLKQLRIIYRASNKNPKWLPVIEAFEHYSHENILQRKRTIQRFITAIKSDMNKPVEENNEIVVSDNYYSDSVVML